jgi:hypothetical protein
LRTFEILLFLNLKNKKTQAASLMKKIIITYNRGWQILTVLFSQIKTDWNIIKLISLL